MAIISRWRWPPENWCGYLRIAASGSGIPTRRTSASARRKARVLRLAMGGHRLHDLPADAVDRVEMAQRVLEDHGDAPAVDPAPLLGRELEQVLALEQDLAAGDLARRPVDQVQDRRGRDRFPRAALAQDGQGLAAVEMPADALDGIHNAARGVEADGEVADLEQMLSHSSCALASSRQRCDRVEGQAQPVRQQVQGQRGQDDGQARPEGEPPRVARGTADPGSPSAPR